MRSIISVFSAFYFAGIISQAQSISGIDSAYLHLNQQYEQYHSVSYIYNDDNSGGNIFIPSVWEGIINQISINQEYTSPPVFGRSSTKFVMNPDSLFSAVKYVYPEDNHGEYPGKNLLGATKVLFKAKGAGVAEFMIGGTNRRPFYHDTLQHTDGVDVRSTGYINLDSAWHDYSIDLNDNVFWVYKDSTQGANNRYPKQAYMDQWWYFTFNYGGDDGTGNTCMKIHWLGDNTNYGGVFLFPPEGNWTGTQGYDLSGITKIRFKAKITQPGKVKFLFGINGDSFIKQEKTISLTTDWTWYEWIVPAGLNYSKVVGGFGFYFGGNELKTPKFSTTFVDSVNYEGVYLANDYTNVICGFKVSANHDVNPNGATIFVDEVLYDKNRTEQSRFCQSYISGSDTIIDRTMKNKADVYDNALTLIADLTRFFELGDSTIFLDAKRIGDAFVYAMNHDRHFMDSRLRNSYMCGDLQHWNETARLPGWWDSNVQFWFEDSGSISTYTSNIAWAAISLIWLYQATAETSYLNGAKTLANWCLLNTQTVAGFTGGFEGSDNNQQKILTKSTLDNINLYAMFAALDSLSPSAEYHNAMQNAANFVYSMWNPDEKYFHTGTYEDGNINTSNPNLGAQACYILAFKDWSSDYTKGITWANQACWHPGYLSPNYLQRLNGFDYNTDKDGIWMEGSAQAALANKMIGRSGRWDTTITSLDYVQTHHKYPARYNFNNKGIVAADHNNLSTGWNFYYHNRLSIGATCWYVFAKSVINPYYYPGDVVAGIQPPASDNIVNLIQNYPNPFSDYTTIKFELTKRSMVNIIVYDALGNVVKVLLNEVKDIGIHEIQWNGLYDVGNVVGSGIYILQFRLDNSLIQNHITIRFN
jgi:hypothetical protein